MKSCGIDESVKAVFKCGSCHKHFTRADALERHSKSCDIGGNDPVKTAFQCGSCSKKFTRPEDLKRHSKSCGVDEVRFHCLLCPKKYSQRNDLKLHIKDKHGDASTSLTLDHSTANTTDPTN